MTQTENRKPTQCEMPVIQDRPELKALQDLSFVELIKHAADTLIEGPITSDGFSDGIDGEFMAFGGQATIGENPHAIEVVQVLVTKRSLVAVYAAQYKGIVGALLRPNSEWAVSVENDGSTYYWCEERHGDTSGLFALAGTDCDEIVSNKHLAVQTMHYYLALGLYLRSNPDAGDLAGSTISPPKLNTGVAYR